MTYTHDEKELKGIFYIIINNIMFRITLITNEWIDFVLENETWNLPKWEFIKAKAIETGKQFFVNRNLINFYKVKKIENEDWKDVLQR